MEKIRHRKNQLRRRLRDPPGHQSHLEFHRVEQVKQIVSKSFITTAVLLVSKPWSAAIRIYVRTYVGRFILVLL